MRVLIIEDEQVSFRRLKRMLSSLRSEMEIEGPLLTVTEVVSGLSEFAEYDLIFADIMLRDKSVFEAFETVRPECPVIFTTAYDEYAIKAFKNNGIDYLLKPIDMAELAAALDKAEKLCVQKKGTKVREHALDSKSTFRERLLLWKGNEMVLMWVKDVNYFYFNKRHVYAKSADGTVHQLQLSMSELEAELDPGIFFRLSRQYLTHINAIVGMTQYDNSRVAVNLKDCDEQIVLSKENSAKLREWLDR